MQQQFAGHPDPEDSFRVVHRDLYRVYLVGTLIAGLDGRRRKLGSRRDPGNPARQGGDGVGPVDSHLHLLALDEEM